MSKAPKEIDPARRTIVNICAATPDRTLARRFRGRKVRDYPRRFEKKTHFDSPTLNSTLQARVNRQFIVNVAGAQSVSITPSKATIPSFGPFTGPKGKHRYANFWSISSIHLRSRRTGRNGAEIFACILYATSLCITVDRNSSSKMFVTR